MKKLAKQIIKEMPYKTTRERAIFLYNSALGSGSLRDCVKLMSKIERELTNRRKKPIYRYEIGIPVSEYWIMEVHATSVKDAIKKIRDDDDSVQQLCSDAAPIGRTKPKVYKKVKL
jgi:hypothetical protein